MSAATRALLALLVALTPLALAASCSKERREPTNPGWFLQCTNDGDCSVGSCLCGRCAVACNPGGACGSGPSPSACFASGSIAFDAFCNDGSVPAALCLASCASDEDCPAGLTCVVGACVPQPRPPVADAGSDACSGQSCPGVQTARDPRFNERALLPPDFRWEPELIDATFVSISGVLADVLVYDAVCPTNDPCPTLEQVLLDDACLDIVSACDLIRVADRRNHYIYWYTGYGTPPVAALRQPGAARTGSYATTRELGCTMTELTMCSTCGDVQARCEDVPGVLPPPPVPTGVNGCECESDGTGGSRVSLDCFCLIYDCNPLADIRDDCRFDENEVGDAFAPLARKGADACGQIWFRTAEHSGRQLAYDASGILVGAVAYSPGPVTAPCASVRVSAGVIADCPEAATCDCNVPVFDDPSIDTSCELEDWFQSL